MNLTDDERIRERAKALWEQGGGRGRIEDHLGRAEQEVQAEQLADLEQNVKADVPDAEQVAGQTDTPVGRHIESIAKGTTRLPPD